MEIARRVEWIGRIYYMILYGKRGLTDKVLLEKTPGKKLVASYMANRWNNVPRRT